MTKKVFYIILSSLLFFTISCSEKKQTLYKLIIEDKMSLFSKDEIKILEKKSESYDYVLYIQTIDKFTSPMISLETDTYFNNASKLCKLKYTDCDSKIIYILISKNPKLIQFRGGNGVNNPLTSDLGLFFGPKYIEFQNDFIKEENIFNTLNEKLGSIFDSFFHLEIPFYKKSFAFFYINFAMADDEVFKLFGDYSSGDILSKPVRYFLTLSAYENEFLGTKYLLFIFIFIFSIMFNVFVILKFFKKPFSRQIVSILFHLIVFVTIAITSKLLSGGRLEDQIMLKNTGIFKETIILFPSEWFIKTTPFYIALLFYPLYGFSYYLDKNAIFNFIEHRTYHKELFIDFYEKSSFFDQIKIVNEIDSFLKKIGSDHSFDIDSQKIIDNFLYQRDYPFESLETFTKLRAFWSSLTNTVGLWIFLPLPLSLILIFNFALKVVISLLTLLMKKFK